ncbi:DNA-binding transcriptional activator GcvA [Litchfieldella qijiaojingensis]|uniref:DNA-binding transcriptional activator GcvA n=1 Tax=Litchfieldella qijiaojingensis TaxID=980347 RepID=A0ABQ2YMG8_9GAMM|nr:LysR substrate-binding domain-containing protein [Halomonas qijiaojingensis]GGX89313.1 DNA-binding transcriptional activator GcvA [Halomonas qijiaojingensis]
MNRTPLPPLATLRAFEAAARLGSFSIAAEELHVTAAAISHRIKALEASLGIRLFDRMARGVSLTETGSRYRERIAEAFAMIEAATEELGTPPLDGPLTVSAPHAFIQHFLLPRLGRLLQRHPGLQLSLNGDDRLADLRGGEADVAIRFGNGHYPGLRVDYLSGDAITVLGPATSSRNEDWQKACFIEDSGATATEPWSHWPPWWREAGLHDPTTLRRLKVSDSGLALAACRQGTGWCLARLSVALDTIQQNQVLPLRHWRRTEFSYYLVTLPAMADTPRVDAFRTWVQDELRDLVQAMDEATMTPSTRNPP